MSPDKRTIFIHDENKIAEMIMEQLQEKLEPSRSTFQVHPLMSKKMSEPSIEETPNEEPLIREPRIGTTPVPARSTSFTPSFKTSSSVPRTPTKNITNLRSFAMSSNRSSTAKRATSNTLLNFVSKKPKLEQEVEMDELEEEEEEEEDVRQVEEVHESSTISISDKSSSITLVDESVDDIKTAFKVIEEVEEFDNREYVESTQKRSSYESPCITTGRTMTIKSVNLQDLSKTQQNEPENDASESLSKAEKTTRTTASIKNTEDNEKAAKALSRVISKPDFARMKVLGQFNLGFIITLLDDKDLYIIDQHASDEKYNFETLQQTTQIETQKLIR